MNRTQRLVTAVTTSLLLTGTIPARGALLYVQGQAAPQQDESWKNDPQVQKAADTISDWLKGTTQYQAKTQEEIVAKFPDRGPDVVAKALKYLLWQKDIRRTGDGSQSSPYRYFTRIASEG